MLFINQMAIGSFVCFFSIKWILSVAFYITRFVHLRRNVKPYTRSRSPLPIISVRGRLKDNKRSKKYPSES